MSLQKGIDAMIIVLALGLTLLGGVFLIFEGLYHLSLWIWPLNNVQSLPKKVNEK